MSIKESTKFLIVDDSESMINAKINHLKSIGLNQYSVAKNGSEALRILNEKPIDLIFCDDNMPVMSGLELLKAVRANDKICHLPFVIILSETKSGYISETISSGVSGLLVKPYTLGKLSEYIEKALSTKHKKISTTAKTATSSVEKVGESATILIVDDMPDNLHLLSDLFSQDYRVRVASNGKKALDICTSDTPPDLVLLDIMMPEMDGFEVAKRMRQHPNSENIPVIFVTGMTDDDTRLKGLEFGAIDFVTKPIIPEILKPRVSNFLRYIELHKKQQSNYDVMLENSRLREVLEAMGEPLTDLIELTESMMKTDVLTVNQIEQIDLVEKLTQQILAWQRSCV